jgi:hypothetical protein
MIASMARESLAQGALVGAGSKAQKEKGDPVARIALPSSESLLPVEPAGGSPPG